MRFSPVFSAVVCSLALGCGGGGGGDDMDASEQDTGVSDTGVDSAFQGDASMIAERTIQEVRDPGYPEETELRFEGVVVTAVDAFGTLNNRIFVQEPEGGELSGVIVEVEAAVAATLAPGDIVSVFGKKREVVAPSDSSGRSSTHIVGVSSGGASIIKTGSGAVPAPAVLNPQLIGTLPLEAEKWESVLVRFENVRALTVPTQVGGDPTEKVMNVTGPLRASSQLAQLGIGGIDLVIGACLAQLTGVLEYSDAFAIAPRSAADLEAGTACPTHTSIVGIQNGTVPVATNVILNDVIVTAIDRDAVNPRVWVSDAAQSALNNGIVLASPTMAAGALTDVSIGSTLRIAGTVEESSSLTQLSNAVIVRTMTSAVNPLPLVVTIATVNATPEPYESVFVSLDDAEVTSLNPDAPSDFGDYVVTSGANSIRIDESIFDTRPGKTIDACITTLNGVIGFASGSFHLSTRRASDVIQGTGCP